MITEYHILNTDDKLVDEIISFFTAQGTNPELFREIKEICIKYSNQLHKPNGESMINWGFLSGSDFLNYMTDTGKIGQGIKTRFVEIALQQLVKNYLITPMDTILVNHQDQRYKVSGEYAIMLYQKGLIKNLLYGLNYIIDSYKASVVKIEPISKEGDYSIGTGFLISEKVNDNYIVVTNRHVVEKSKSVKVFKFDDDEIQIVKVFEDNERDIALILVAELFNKPFFLSKNLNVLTEIITIGYPTIPTTKNAYRVYHKGEVNSFVEDYWNNKLFLISAKTSSGNSGSPIIDKTGMVVGIISEELFEKEAFFEKGKLPYYAGIPTDEILKSVDKLKAHMK